MSRRCAFLSLQDRSGFHIYDHLAIEPLRLLNWVVEEIPWDQPGADWSEFDAVVIRSTWDYQNDPAGFMATLQRIAEQTTLFNPIDVCKWNMNKGYLRQLQENGVTIVPTQWLASLDAEAIEAAFESGSANRMVAKPLVGANADDTFVLKAGEQESWNGANQVFAEKELMLQPFVTSIQNEGEYSLFYFGGEFSHAIVKRPAEGDFRVQEEHGGIIAPIQPAKELLLVGEKAIDAIGQTLLYARVDLVRLDSGQPALIELELIEPSLYFEQCEGSAERFASHFARMASR